MCGHDGISGPYGRPQPVDGDTLFAVSTASEESAAQETALEETASTHRNNDHRNDDCPAASSQVVCDAIVHAVVHAVPVTACRLLRQLAKPANPRIRENHQPMEPSFRRPSRDSFRRINPNTPTGKHWPHWG